ncbi:ferredoxin [Gordonia paraffinivorans]|uniref:ferredoxin n=1 Tax=Gordonia TaxID=2053 RepID=UPI000D61B9A0|nr:ferredoxin [Gordonia paraffinivorans]MBY4575776.1 ferredoxin [Gordonia paraffinivorans]PWD44264.1 ferredoxin [Gordonia paraffinivorans]
MSSTQPTLTVDRVACAGHGLCYGVAPDLIDADDQGDPVVPERPLAAGEIALANEAIAMCPERALALQPTNSTNSKDQ